MGLDMYLTANIRLGKYCTKRLKDADEKVRKIFKDEIFKSGNLDSLGISFEAGYWRKANQIHKWFVDNCQDGKDECQSSCVTRKQLTELKELCEKVLKILSKQEMQEVTLKDRFSKEDYNQEVYTDAEEIKKLLPTSAGFFFGITEYDEYYKNDIELTIEIINKCLKLPEEWCFEYRASW